MTAPERRVRCVFCGSPETEEFSLYGQTLMGSQHYCRECRTVFEVIRYDDDPDDQSADPDDLQPSDSPDPDIPNSQRRDA